MGSIFFFGIIFFKENERNINILMCVYLGDFENGVNPLKFNFLYMIFRAV